MPDDPDVIRTWSIAQTAEMYGVLPTIVERTLRDDDAAVLTFECMRFSAYAEAYRAYKASKKADDLKPWRKSVMMKAVMKNANDLHKSRVKAQAEERARKAQEAREVAAATPTLGASAGRKG